MTADLVFAVPAHRGRGVIHLAYRHWNRSLDPRDPGLLRLNTNALCGASTAAGLHHGIRVPQVVRPGESLAETPTCPRCLAAGRSFPTPGQVIPRAALAVEDAAARD